MIDNKAEKYYPTSTYTYALNNPIKFIDPDGNEIKGFSVNGQGQVVVGKNASRSAVKIYNAMSQTKTGRTAFKSMMSMSTKVTLKLVRNSENYVGKTKGGKVTADGHFDEAKVLINVQAIKSKDSRFASLEEGMNAVGVHESVHLTPEQIAIDEKRESPESDPDYYKNEEAPMNAEYDAREDYRNEKGLENEEWKKPYESTTDSDGDEKPSYQGTKNKKDESNGS